MMVRRLSAVDAQMYCMSAKIPNDQCLLYGFAGVPSDVEETLASVRVRAGGCADLCLRVRDRGVLTYPAWVPGDVSPDQFVVHELDDNSWAGCLAAIARLPAQQMEAQAMNWRLHVIAPVDALLGDGIRSSALAAWVFGRAGGVPPLTAPPPFRVAALPWVGLRAARAHRQLV